MQPVHAGIVFMCHLGLSKSENENGTITDGQGKYSASNNSTTVLDVQKHVIIFAKSSE